MEPAAERGKKYMQETGLERKMTFMKENRPGATAPRVMIRIAERQILNDSKVSSNPVALCVIGKVGLPSAFLLSETHLSSPGTILKAQSDCVYFYFC